MIKKIRVPQLRVGMYVCDFNAGWLEHPFLTNSMALESDDQVAKVVEAGIREVYIDTARGLDVEDAPTAEEARLATESALAQLAVTPAPAPRASLPPPSSLAEELSRVRNTFGETSRAVRCIMEDVRLGRQIEMEAVEPVVERITSSVLRNSNAMLTLRRLQQRYDYIYLHSLGVCAMLTSFAKYLGEDLGDIYQMALGGLLLDIGVMRLNPEILNKPGKLNGEEFRHVRSHVLLGADLLRQLQGIPTLALQILEQHHERQDGSGYPRGLSGDAISRVGRMAAIVDVYDAITSDRVYHPRLDPASAIRKLFDWSRFQFDSELTQAFIRSVGIYPVGTLVRLESGRLGIVTAQREKSLLQPVVRVIFDTKRNYYLPPTDVDLSRPLGQGGGDRIVGNESPAQWGIEVQRFLL